ncbi:MAG: ATP synthase F1 subunit delta [Candidatus Melainabacteria bacterium]|nr:ATP synthase F1 subunit delta [Candidatus Melainabacteria bacterium]
MMMMSSSTTNTTFSAVAKQYATSLYELAKEQSVLKAITPLVGVLSQVIEKTPELIPFLANATISAEKRAGILIELLPSDTPDVLGRFLTLVIENNRHDELPDILACFYAKAEALDGIGLVEVTTAFPLTSTLKKSLETALKTRFSLKSIHFKETVDSSLKAGLVLTYNGQRLDATLQTRLTQLQKTLQQI